MNKERMEIRVIRILSNITLLLGVRTTISILAGEEPLAGRLVSLCLIGLVLLGDQVQHRVRGFMPYMLSILGLGALTLLAIWLCDPELFLPFAVLAGLDLCCLIGARARQKPAFIPNPGFMVLPASMYLIGIGGNYGELKSRAILTEIVLILLFLGWLNQKSLEQTTRNAKEHVRVPYGKIRSLNRALLLVYLLGAGALCLVLTLICGSDETLMLIPRFGVELAMLIFVAFVRLASFFMPDFMSGPVTGGMGGYWDLSGLLEKYPWLRWVWITIEVVLAVVGTLLLLWLTWHMLKNLYYQLQSADPETGDKAERSRSVETRSRFRSRRKKERNPFSREKGIRREYIRFMDRLPGRDEIRISQSPEEMEQTAAGEDFVRSERGQKIHRLYEKARYAGESATPQEVRAFSALIREGEGTGEEKEEKE